MWEEMDEETRALYGREYLDAHLEKNKISAAAGGDMNLVLTAMSDALLSLSPKRR